MAERVFDENIMYAYIEAYASKKMMIQTSKALVYAKKCHDGQLRKGVERVPYIYHPLLVASHALALGLDEDHLVAAALLHDVCEDCGVKVDELPFHKDVKVIVGLLTKEKGYDKLEYFRNISENPEATMIKLIDRCSNISGMASAFSDAKMIKYMNETRQMIMPLLEQAKQKYHQYAKPLFLIEYHIESVLAAVERITGGK